MSLTGPQGKKGKSVQSRLVMLLLFILIPVLAIQAYMYYDHYQIQMASEAQANLEIARAVANTFESFVEDVIHHELVIGLAITSSQPLASQDITRLLISSQGYVAVRDFTWMNPAGDAIYSGNPSVIGQNYSDRSYFRDVANGREWTVSELIISRATGKPVFGISRGIRDENRALLGVVVAMIMPDNLDARLAVERGKGGGHSLIDHKGMMVYRYPAINPTWEERYWLKQYPRIEETLKGKELARSSVFATFEGKNRVAASTPVPSIGWAVTAGRTEEEVTGPILNSIAHNAFLFLSVSLAAFFIALAISRKIASPITELGAHALAVGRGEMPEQVRNNHVSEFQALADAFNAMAKKVQAREMALRESEQRVSLAVNNAGMGTWDADLRTGRVVWSESHFRLLGYEPKSGGEATMEMWRSLVHPDDLERVLSAVETSKRERSLYAPEHRIIRADTGEVVWLSVFGRFLYDNGGEPIRFIGVFLDTTERKKAEKALEQSERRFRALTEKGGELITVLDATGTITYNIAGSNSTLGYPAEELVGRNAFELAHPDDLPHLLNMFHEGVSQPGRIEHAEFRLRAKDGSWRWQLAVGTNLLDDPAVGGILVNSRDITERKNAEEKLRISEASLRQANEHLEQRVQERTADLKERAEQLGRLASQITMVEQHARKQLAQILHDGLQQYLVAAKLQVGGLIEQAPDALFKRAADEVDTLLGESIRVSRSLAAELSPRVLHESGLLAGLDWLSSWMSDKHGLKVELAMKMDAPILPEDVKLLLFESVRELLLNVVKHAKTNSATVSLTQENGRSLQIMVSDNGVGFDLASGSANDGNFGLFSIRERLSLIGGRFEIDSSPGNGACFTLTAPLAIDNTLESMPCAQPIQVDPTVSHCMARSAGKIRIVITDDHAVMREGLARLLGHEPDFEVVGQANDGLEAVEKAGALDPDVILMDISMPRMNGIDAARMIHQRHPDIRIIGLSLYPEKERAKAMLDAGAVFYLNKSGSPVDLKTAIRACAKEKPHVAKENSGPPTLSD